LSGGTTAVQIFSLSTMQPPGSLNCSLPRGWTRGPTLVIRYSGVTLIIRRPAAPSRLSAEHLPHYLQHLLNNMTQPLSAVSTDDTTVLQQTAAFKTSCSLLA
jgi:hypothetical protein